MRLSQRAALAKARAGNRKPKLDRLRHGGRGNMVEGANRRRRKRSGPWTAVLALGLVLLTPAFAEEEASAAPPPAPAAVPATAPAPTPEPVAEVPATPAPAEEAAKPAEPPKKKGLLEAYQDSKPLFGKYGRWIRHQEKMLLSLDLWGVTTAPEGYLVATFGWGTLRPYKRFDNDRKLVEILPILSFPDPFGGDGKFLEFDFGVRGKGQGYLLALMYGVTDNVMVGISTQMMVTEIKIDPIFTPGTVDKLGIASLDDFMKMLEVLGRPRPKLKYATEGVDFGDTLLGVTWAYYRNKWFSGGITGNVFLPTAHTADPNQNLVFGLGPDIDTGNAAWGVNLSLPFGFRPPAPVDVVSFSFGIEGAYYFPSARHSPEFLPINQDVRDYIQSQGVDVDLFQDLTDMDPYYYYTPGPWAAVSAGIGVGPLSISYRHGWGWEGNYDTNSPGFKRIIKEIGLVGSGDDGKVTAALSLPLTPLYIPGLIQFRFEYQTDGRNQLVFRDRYMVGCGIALPVGVPDRYKMKKEGK
jgi:hypothetical protein